MLCFQLHPIPKLSLVRDKNERETISTGTRFLNCSICCSFYGRGLLRVVASCMNSVSLRNVLKFSLRVQSPSTRCHARSAFVSMSSNDSDFRLYQLLLSLSSLHATSMHSQLKIPINLNPISTDESSTAVHQNMQQQLMMKVIM